MDPGGIKHRENIRIDVHDKVQFGAGKDNRIRAVLRFGCDDALEVSFGVSGHFADHQFIVDDLVQDLDIAHVGRKQIDPVRDEPPAIKALGHHVACTDTVFCWLVAFRC